ncbi:MAG: hypothetical protein COA42_15855 [Alteromonadaceae bacterium]|nr:MAG: hypothetical protein COA42_15855 [Alteromonadaceae bacterium]
MLSRMNKELLLAAVTLSFFISARVAASAPYIDGFVGTEGNDALYAAGSTSAHLIGLGGDDKLQGASGDDVLEGGLGRDMLKGGQGNDVYVYNLNDGNDVITNYDYTALEERRDVIRFGEGITLNDLMFEKDRNDLLITIVPTNEVITVRVHFLSWDNQFLTSINALEFSDGSEFSAKNIKALIFSGSAEDDSIEGLRDSDLIKGLAGNDMLWGYGGDDFIHGGDGEDSLFGGEGNDWLNGGPDDDFLKGGEGDDRYVHNLGDGHDDLVNYESGVPGNMRNDRLWFGEGVLPENVRLTRVGQHLLIEVLTEGGVVESSVNVINHFLISNADGEQYFELNSIQFYKGINWGWSDIVAMTQP